MAQVDGIAVNAAWIPFSKVTDCATEVARYVLVAACVAVNVVVPALMMETSPVTESIVATDGLLLVKVNALVLFDVGAATV